MEIPYVVTPRKDTGLFNSKIAIWLFLASEVMLFGGFFSAYIFLRLGADYPWPERTLPVLPGLINTFILIASSVTVVFAWASLKMRQWRRFQVFMGITVACAAIFMVLKGVEYSVKWKHAAVRLDDYSVLEGHLGYEKEDGDYLKDPSGKKIQANHLRFEASSVTFDLGRYHKPWVADILLAASGSDAEITLAGDFNLNREDTERSDRSPVVEEGEPLSFDALATMRSVFEENRTHNSKWRIKFHRQAWDDKWDEVKRNDRFGEAAFVNEFPKALEMERGERDRAYRRWKAGMRSRLATEVNLEDATIELGGADLSYADLERPVQGTATFTFSDPVILRFKSHDVTSSYEPGGERVTLRDGTTVDGEYVSSPMVFHDVDGIDFQHTAMIAEERDQEPLVAIENSWLIRENPVVSELWEMHRQTVGQLEENLKEDGREPTEKDLYRMDWQTIAHYMDLREKHQKAGKEGLPEVKLAPNAVAAPKVRMTAKEHFMGPDYDVRSFPEVKVPREEVALDSKFTPRWNTYYAIYFAITGLHGLHVIGGAIVLGYYLFFGRKMYLSNPEWLANRVEVGGLFWHFVDLIWIFAFPIFYLM